MQYIHYVKIFIIHISKDRKGSKKKAKKELLKQEDTLPSEKFDYSSISFSNFQGGSMGQDANHVQFQQPKVSRYNFIFLSIICK
jgi:hypothetical protein